MVLITSTIILLKPVKSAIMLDPEDKELAQDIGGNTVGNYIRVQMPFHSLMTKFFEVSNIEQLIQNIFAYIRMQVGNTRMH